VEHSYYLSGNINAYIRAGIDGKAPDHAKRPRRRHATLPNVRVMK
jgi:hypothetical protein